MDILKKLREVGETPPEKKAAPVQGKVLAAPYHKRIYLSLSEKDRTALKQQAYESIRKNVMSGTEAVGEEFEYVTTGPLELSADQCSAHFDGMPEDKGFMDINWELIGEDIPKGMKLTVQGEFAYGDDSELMAAIKKFKTYSEFNEDTTGVYDMSLSVDGDPVMQWFYSSPKGKQLFMDYIKEEGVKIKPSDLTVEWGTEDYHSYTIED